MAAFFALLAGLAIGILATLIFISWTLTYRCGRDMLRAWLDEADRQDI